MCHSLQVLAANARAPPIEPECHTNQECNGIVCELDILGFVFYLESIILPCESAVDVVVRDSQNQALFMSVYNRTETHSLSFGIFTISLFVKIVRHNYSMEVSVSLYGYAIHIWRYIYMFCKAKTSCWSGQKSRHALETFVL